MEGEVGVEGWETIPEENKIRSCAVRKQTIGRKQDSSKWGIIIKRHLLSESLTAKDVSQEVAHFSGLSCKFH
jgi:hypothetical protein